MKRAAEDSQGDLGSRDRVYGPVLRELDDVEAMLQAEFSSTDPFVDRLARHGFRLGGKRLRPALVLLAGMACGNLRREHSVVGVVMEMVHVATLLHDDVLDEATSRRHRDTINARWNNEASILLGDYLLARAIERLGTLESPYACRTIGAAAKIVCEGELRQVFWRGNFDLSEQDYLQIIADKTAELTACCCRLGAHFSGADEALAEKFARFGRYLGVAFQIADDLLDIVGDEKLTGKSLGSDLLKQKPTLPLIRLLVQVNGSEKAELLEILTRLGNHRLEALRGWFERYDSIDYSRAEALRYARMAAAEVADLPPGPARDALVKLTDFVVARRQ